MNGEWSFVNCVTNSDVRIIARSPFITAPYLSIRYYEDEPIQSHVWTNKSVCTLACVCHSLNASIHFIYSDACE